MKITYIYGIRDLEIDKFIYVGKGDSPQGRLIHHKSFSTNTCIKGAFDEKGKENLQVEVLETVQYSSRVEWLERERFWIAKLRKECHPLCNKNKGGAGPPTGRHLTEETKKKISRANSSPSEETRAKLSKAMTGKNNPMYGKHHTEEWKHEQSKRSSGENNYFYGRDCSGEKNVMYGKHHTEESKAKMRKKTKDWLETHDHPNLGKHHSKEAKARMGEANSGPYPTFYNSKTKEYIPAGKNPTKLCREQDLNCGTLSNLKRKSTKQSRDGWRLATKEETNASLSKQACLQDSSTGGLPGRVIPPR